MASSLAVLKPLHTTQGSTQGAAFYSINFSTNSYFGNPVATTSLNFHESYFPILLWKKPRHQLRHSVRFSNLSRNPLTSLTSTSLQLLLAAALLWVPFLCSLMKESFVRTSNISQEDTTRNSLSWRNVCLGESVERKKY